MKSSQERGRTLESPPQRKGVKYSKVIILVVCACMVTDSRDRIQVAACDKYDTSDEC